MGFLCGALTIGRAAAVCAEASDLEYKYILCYVAQNLPVTREENQLLASLSRELSVPLDLDIVTDDIPQSPQACEALQHGSLLAAIGIFAGSLLESHPPTHLPRQ